jgi:hypothetical protein
MNEFTLWDIVQSPLAVPWTRQPSRFWRRPWRSFCWSSDWALKARLGVKLYVELFQSTPLLMQLFLVYFGLPLLGIDVSAWLAAAACLTLYSSAFLTDIGEAPKRSPRPVGSGAVWPALRHTWSRSSCRKPPHGKFADRWLSVQLVKARHWPPWAIAN